ncbi:MAG: phosphotransferase system lactose/cellobiose-specific subunit [Firmicutes bacterium]|nr:phosphotransferase system lactose/cellobiose-specific subunit [Bacillota bacterium]
MDHVAFTLILHAGNARSYCFEALNFARIGKHKEAFECLKESTKELQKAHTLQTNLLQTEAKGEKLSSACSRSPNECIISKGFD